MFISETITRRDREEQDYAFVKRLPHGTVLIET